MYPYKAPRGPDAVRGLFVDATDESGDVQAGILPRSIHLANASLDQGDSKYFFAISTFCTAVPLARAHLHLIAGPIP